MKMKRGSMVFYDAKDLMKDPKWAKAVRKRTGLVRETAQVLLDVRIEMGLSQKELAKKIGTTQSVIARAESGRTGLNLTFLDRIAKACGTHARIVFESMPEIVPIAVRYADRTTTTNGKKATGAANAKRAKSIVRDDIWSAKVKTAISPKPSSSGNENKTPSSLRAQRSNLKGPAEIASSLRSSQ